jgi:hypothetical protein
MRKWVYVTLLFQFFQFFRLFSENRSKVCELMSRAKKSKKSGTVVIASAWGAEDPGSNPAGVLGCNEVEMLGSNEPRPLQRVLQSPNLKIYIKSALCTNIHMYICISLTASKCWTWLKNQTLEACFVAYICTYYLGIVCFKMVRKSSLN